MVTLPKLMDPGVTPRVPVVVVPLPVRETLTKELEAFELRERVALSVPAAVGEKTTDRLALLPGARV